MARAKSFSKIIEELLTTKPELATTDSETFLSVFKENATKEGIAKLPDDWNILRARFKVKSKLAGKTKKKLTSAVQNLLNKARQSALEAVGSYNNPLSPFRSGSYVVMMYVAWTSLLLAVLCNRGVKPYCVDSKTCKFKKRADGDYKFLSLTDCIKQLKSEIREPIRHNLRFFIGLRNKIEHALMPELDLELFGECQAMLIDFEEMVVREFGEEYALNESLAFSLQFSRLRTEEQDQAARLLHSTVKRSVRNYIDKFRSSLSDDILGDMAYSFKVFLIPNVGNHRSKDALAIEWVHYDPNDPEQMENYTKSVALIKDRHIPVSNLNTMKAGEVARRIRTAIGRPFNASTHHARCWRHFGVRPPSGTPNPERCDTKYCIYDKAHRDYVYTDKWVEKLINELSDHNKYKAIIKGDTAIRADRQDE